MPTAKEIFEKRAAVGADIKKLRDKIDAENRNFTSEEDAQWDKLNGEWNTLNRQLEIAKRSEEIDAAMNDAPKGKPGREDVNHSRRSSNLKPEERAARREEVLSHAIEGWCRAQLGHEINERQERAMKKLGISPRKGEIVINLSDTRSWKQKCEQRAAQTVTTSGGGYIIPQGFSGQLEEALLEYGGVETVADVMITDSGNPMPWPTVDDTGNTGENIAINTAAAEQALVFGQTTFNAYKQDSGLVLVPSELMEDSAFDLLGFLSRKLGERLARRKNSLFTTGAGSGSSLPQGVVVGSTLGTTAASATAIAADELITFQHTVDPAYRRNARWMMHDNILAAIRKLKDSQNRYLFMEAPAFGIPDKLLGSPLSINQQMQSSIATGTKTILYGDFKKYKIRQVRQIRLRRLVERYADADQEGFVAWNRCDGKVLDAGTHPIRHFIQA